MVEHPVNAPSLAAVIGTGRSGTTWLGSMINSHPRVAYRFEPFHRAAPKSGIRAFQQLMSRGEFKNHHIPLLYEQLIRADPTTEKPPFFNKEGMQAAGVQTWWKITRVAKPLRPLFATMFTPRDGRLLVFKEVTFEDTLDNLLQLENLPVVYLLRHPSATVASLLRGQGKKLMSTGRLTVVKSLLQKHDPELAERFSTTIDSMDNVELNALLWRIDTEKAIRAINKHKTGYLLTYEQLCDDAHKHVREICTLLGIDFHHQMEAFLDRLYTVETTTASNPTDVRNKYFTVYRNPKLAKDAWKKNWSVENEKKVSRIVNDSITIQQCAAMGNWQI